MLNQWVVSFKSNSLLFQIIAGCCLGLMLGIACLQFPPLIAFTGMAVVVFAYAILKKPEIALMGILIATSSIIFEDQLPMITLGVSLHISDILLLGSLGLIAIRLLVEPNFKIVRTPLDAPLLIFFGITLLSTLVAVYQFSVDAELARRWIRVLSYYLTFFIVTHVVRDLRQLNFLLNSFFILAAVVALAMVTQFLLGSSVQLLPGRVETLSAEGNVTRISPPGFSVALVSFVALLCILAFEKSKLRGWLEFLLCGLLGMAVVLTFLRSYWAILIVVVILLGFLFKGIERQKFIGWGFLVASLTAIFLLFVFSSSDSKVTRLVSASIDRLSTLGDSKTYQGGDASLNWRMIENEYALSAIAANPWIGMGMGFTYRPWDSRIDIPGNTYDFRKHIHNGHFWIILQSGLLGYLSFIWLSLAFLIRGFKHWRSIGNDYLRGVVIGFTVAYLAILVAAAVNSTFMQWRWTPVIGIMMGVNEVILMKFCQEKALDQSDGDATSC